MESMSNKTVISFRISQELLETLKKKSKELGFNSFSSFLIFLLKQGLENIRLTVDEKINLLLEEINELRKREEESYKSWKSMLRSNEYGYLLKDIEMGRKDRIRLLLENDEIPTKLKNGIIGNLMARSYYAEKISEKYAEVLKLIEYAKPELKEKILKEIYETDFEEIYSKLYELAKYINNIKDLKGELAKDLGKDVNEIEKLIKKLQALGWISINEKDEVIFLRGKKE